MRHIIFVFLFCSNWLIFSQSNIKKDIDDKYLDKLYVENDSSLTADFQRFAIDLFRNGTMVNGTILRSENYKVGVTL